MAAAMGGYFKGYVVWWSSIYLGVNSIMTIAITARLVCVADKYWWSARPHIRISVLRKQASFSASRCLLLTAGRAIIESAFISWVAVLLALIFEDTPRVS
jgi:hypothetical protein